ncbi:MAG: alanyl-tRNA editing protein [Proteobacteria bacterium]|nr:alanyl-tRNA editing protein [Pseudomonadota bacterium]
MASDLLFREDAYLKECSATVTAITDTGGIVLDRTVFYATSGGQPGDSGVLTTRSGDAVLISTAAYCDADKSEIAHIAADAGSTRLTVGDPVHALIDWEQRYRYMRMHTALHLLSAVLPYPVTGGSVGANEGRLDFDIPEAGLDKDEISERIKRMIASDSPVCARWITDAELVANPGLIKTMSVKPPMGTGRVRLVEILGIDLQPCGGTHVRTTREIGTVRATQVEKKGKINRRVRVAFA